jgi:hypothetical protein
LTKYIYPKSALFFCFSFFAHFLFAQPQISHFTPSSGPVGTSVIISGSNFDASPSNNIVYFGSVKATVTAASANSLTVVVPAGLSTAPVSVTTGGLTGISNTPFALTFSGGGVLDTGFIRRTDIPVYNDPENLIPADFDGDGKPDIIAWEGPILAVHTNTSSGDTLSFSFGASFQAGSFTVGDIDGDGKPDILVLYLGTVKIVRNTSSPGSISFDNPVVFPVSSQGDIIALADMDGDGKTDLVIEDATGFFSILRNTSSPGNFSLAAGISYDPHEGQYSLNFADMDGDGKPDIILPASSYGVISIFRNLSTAGNISLDTMISYQSTGNLSDGPIAVATGDLNGDGKTDFAVVNYNGSSVSVFKNTGVPGMLSFAPPAIYACGSNPRAVVIGDLDGDGRPDMAIANSGEYSYFPDNSVTLYKNSSSGGILSFSNRSDVPVVPDPQSLYLCDLDGNGKYDLAVGSASNPFISVLRYNVNPNGPPRIVSFSPALAGTGDTVLITGVNFTSASAVSFGGRTATSYQVISSSNIKAIVNSGSSGNVSLTTPNGMDSLKGFVFNAPPTIQSFLPDSGSTGTPILIKGKNLYSATVINFGGTAAESFTVLNDSLVQAVVGTGASGNLTITTQTGSIFIPGFKYFIRPSPIVHSFSPGYGSPGSAIIITGDHFTGTGSIYFGTVPAASFTVLTDSTISAIVGDGESGNIKVITPSGTDSLAGFRFIQPGGVRIDSFSPMSGWEGVMVTIHGVNFTNTTSVSFGGTRANYFNIDSDTLMEAWIGFGSTGALMVTTYGSSDSLGGFVYTTRPPDVLPFLMDQLSATLSGSSINVQWQSENDQSISHYILSSGPDSISMQPLASLPSNQIPGVNNYSFMDSLPKYSPEYYQLQAVDTLGNIVYSGFTTASKPVTNSIKIFPNPATSYIMVDHPLQTTASEIKIMDMMGKVLQRIPVAAGTAETKVVFSSAWKGFYKIVWTDGTKTLNQSVIINR